MTDRKQETPKIFGVYNQSILSKKLHLSIREIGKNIKKILEEKASELFQGKCIAEGFIKPGSISIISYSAGVVDGETIEIQVIFDCMICSPVEGTLVECVTKTITKAGIHATCSDKDGTIPLTVFIARDHHNTSSYFNNMKEDVPITARIIGVRYELNDPYICAIAALNHKTQDNKNTRNKTAKK